MNRIAAALLLLVALCATAQAKPAKTAPPASAPVPDVLIPAAPSSFHGIPWGTPLSEVKDMEVRERTGPAAYAKAKNIAPRIVDVDVNDLVYAFCEDRFAGAMAAFQGKDRYDALLALLAARYGQPVRPAEDSANVGWPLGDVLIMLEFDAPIAAGTLSYLHTPTYAPCTAPEEPPTPGAAPGTAPAAEPQATPKAPPKAP